MVAALLLLAALRPAAAEAADGFLELHVEPVIADVPGAATLKGKRLWKVLTSPPPTVIADEPFRTTLQDQVDSALEELHPWITNFGSEWSLIARLEGTMRAADLKFQGRSRVDDRVNGRQVSHLLPAAPTEGPAHFFIPFTYTLTPMAKLRIEAASATEATPADVAFRELPLPADLRASLAAENREADANLVVIHLRGKGKQFAAGEEDRLLKVARHALTVARKQNALPPRPLVGERTREAIVLIVRATLIPQPQPLKTAVTFGPDAGDPALWILAVRNITPIEAVKIDARYDLASLLAPETTVDDRTKARFTARAAQVAAELEQRFEDAFAPLRGTVATGDELDAVMTRLRTEGADKIAKVEDPRVDHGVLTFPIVIKPTVKTLVGSGGIGYTPREGLTGTAGLTGQNLLGWNDSVSLDVKGGADARRGDFNFGVPIPPRWWNNDERVAARVSLHGLYARTDDTVLGQPRSATVLEEEYGARLRHSLTFHPFARRGDNAEPGARAPSTSLGLSESTALGVDVELGRRDVTLRGVEAPAGIPVDGVTAPLLLTLRASTGFEPRDKTGVRLRGVDLRLESTFERSFAILGSDLRYDRWDVRASIEGLFWLFSATPQNDVLLRYVHGFGTASGGTPLFRFLRVGGESNVRGVEEGEFIGRRLHFQQAEVGLGVCSLQQLIFGKKGAAAAAPAGETAAPAGRECQAGGLDLSRAFVKMFVDHTDVAERVVGPRFEQGARGIFGGGVALELHELPVGNQKLSLTLGYAYSPDSRRHSSGTVFTQVIVPFSLR